MSNLPAPRFLDRRSPPHLLTLVLLAGLAALSQNIFLPSLPGMARWFGSDYRVMQLSVSAYLAMSAVLQLVIGPVSDRFGRRDVLLWSLGLFIVATVGAILAPNVTLFLAFRMAQAVVAAGMVLSRAVVRDMVGGDRAASMIGYVTMGMALVPMIGPALGGFLDEALGWQASFLFLALCGALVLGLTWADLGETAPRRATGLADQLRQYPALFRSGRFWGYCLSATFASGSFFAYLGGAPFVGEVVLRLEPAEVGLWFAAPAIGYALGNFVAGRFSTRIGAGRMMITGTALATLSLGLGMVAAALFAPHPALFFPFVGIMAVGNGMSLPNANAGMLSVRPDLAGSASGLGGAIMIGGGAVLAAAAGLLLDPLQGDLMLAAAMAASSALSLVVALALASRGRGLAD